MKEDCQQTIEQEIETARQQVANTAWTAFQKTARLKKADYIAHLGIVLPSLFVPGIPAKYRAAIFAATVLTNAIRSHMQTSQLRKDFNEHYQTLSPMAQEALVIQKAAFDMFSPEAQKKTNLLSAGAFASLSPLFSLYSGSVALGITYGASMTATVKNYADHMLLRSQHTIAKQTYTAVTGGQDVAKQKTKPFPNAL